jgi:DNA-binding response OmpR family regulator
LRTVLIIEDEMIIALDLEQTLSGAGFATLGPARSIEAAMALVETESFDCALVDLELQGVLATSLVERLRTLGKKFAFVTGFDRGDLPEQFGTEPVITKPWEPSYVIETVRQLCAASSPRRAGGLERGCTCEEL